MRSAVRTRYRCRAMTRIRNLTLRRHGRFAALLTSLLVVAGCGQQPGTVLGRNPEGVRSDTLAIRAGDTPPDVVIQGKLVEKCPQAGCWFKVDDGAGIIKVDTKAAGFVVTDIPLETVVTVGGKIVMVDEEQQIEATGLRY